MNRLTSILLPAVLFFVWLFLSILGVIDHIFLPSPWSVAKSLIDGIFLGDLIKDTTITIARSAAGFLISSIIGIPLGLLIGRNKLAARIAAPTIDFFRSIPATALFPLFLFCFGVGDKAKIAIVVYACSLIILVNTAYGAMQVKELRILCAKVIGANRINIFWKIIIPESSPGIFAGLRVALCESFVLIVVAEMFIGTTVGLGYQIMNSQMVYRTSDMYAGILLTGFIGYLANKTLLVIERKTLHWIGR